MRRLLLVAIFVATPLLPQELPPDAIARFHINNANYLADVGKYLEALEELNTAFDFSQAAAIKAEASSLKANLLSAFLDNPQAAVVEYNTILQNFAGTPFYEPAIFQSGMLRYETGDLPGARTFFERYIREFPTGARSATAEFLLRQIAAGERLPAVEKPPPSRNIKIALKELDAVVFSSAQPMNMDGTSIGTSARLTSDQLQGRPVTVTSNSPIRVDGRAYRGEIILIPESGGLRVVNDVPIEEYLYSVVSSEVSPSWPAEALKAQAVAARTYAYYHVLHPRSPGKFDVFDDIRSQVYGGYAREHPRVREAVDSTRGQVLLHDSKVVLAYFTSNNGGTMADPGFVFGTALPYFKPNPDEYSGGQPLGKWTRRFPIAAVEEALRKAGYRVSTIRGITPVKICPSGRLVELIVEYNDSRLKLNTRAQFRRAINQHVQPMQQPENLPEILMSININGQDIEMSGGGWGHGVGMSQYGAKGMAEKGLSYTKILASYYVGSELKAMY